MKRVMWAVLGSFLIVNALPGAEQSCIPLRRTYSPAAAPPKPVVAIYWDISGSVDRRFDNHVQTLVSTIDSRVLPLAGAEAPIRHYTVGETVSEATNATAALTRKRPRSALHEAARMIGADLARSLVGAAILVTDLEVDRPEVPPKATAVCGDVPIPTDRNAGPLIGRCFSAGWRLAPFRKGARRPSSIDHLMIAVLRSRYAAPIDNVSRRHLYIILFATDLRFAHKIEEGLRERLSTEPANGYEWFTIVDTSTIPRVDTAWERGDGRAVRNASGYSGYCAFACYKKDVKLNLYVHVIPSPTRALIRVDPKPKVLSADGSAALALRRDRWDVNWTMPCVLRTTQGFVHQKVQLQFGWSAAQRLPKEWNIDHPSVEDALLSMIGSVRPLLSPRGYSAEIGLR